MFSAGSKHQPCNGCSKTEPCDRLLSPPFQMACCLLENASPSSMATPNLFHVPARHIERRHLPSETITAARGPSRYRHEQSCADGHMHATSAASCTCTPGAPVPCAAVDAYSYRLHASCRAARQLRASSPPHAVRRAAAPAHESAPACAPPCATVQGDTACVHASSPRTVITRLYA